MGRRQSEWIKTEDANAPPFLRLLPAHAERVGLPLASLLSFPNALTFNLPTFQRFLPLLSRSVSTLPFPRLFTSPLHCFPLPFVSCLNDTTYVYLDNQSLPGIIVLFHRHPSLVAHQRWLPAARSSQHLRRASNDFNGHTSGQVRCIDLSPVFATLTKTAGVYTHSSHSGTPRFLLRIAHAIAVPSLPRP